ncbi:MAG: isochorismatase family protein [Rhodoplanes sp.]
MAKRIIPDQCFGALIDVQEFFLSGVDKSLRPKLKTNAKHFVRLLGYFRIPLVVTLERPVVHKGRLPKEIKKQLGDHAQVFEKDYFDLAKDGEIRAQIGRLKKKQAIIAGCETDVCVLQSCLGLLDLGYEVFLVEELLFSSSRNVDAAIARMQAAGAVILSYKSLYYELVEAVEGGPHWEERRQALGPFPEDLPDTAA